MTCKKYGATVPDKFVARQVCVVRHARRRVDKTRDQGLLREAL